ncbi:MAG: family 1 glycosylhydrolase [Clostridiales bacterium]|jgi:beta-glucosidase|nr:family 1 glycosylhydrolase [Clostridiales bacterium]
MFDKSFLLGAATAAHQVEGNNIHSDFWSLEQDKNGGFKEPSLDAIDHYNLWKEDITLLKEAGLNAYRFSIEWARIEPEEGVFDQKELDHYKAVLEFCRSIEVEPIVTLHHFSSPKWLTDKGGWENPQTIDFFARYCKHATQSLGHLLGYVCTINEANMGLQLSAIIARYLKQMGGNVQVGVNLDARKKYNTFLTPRTAEADILVMKAHQQAKIAIKEIFPNLKVGLTLSLHDLQAEPGGEEAAEREWNNEFLLYLPYFKDDDFLGVQNYTREVFGKDGIQAVPKGNELTQADYEFYPEALEHVLRRVAQSFKGDLIVTENGIASTDDSRRVEFIRRAIAGVQSCIASGLPIKGYMHWSLIDNFEWQQGFKPKFGLIAVDRTTQARFPKESLGFLGSMR